MKLLVAAIAGIATAPAGFILAHSVASTPQETEVVSAPQSARDFDTSKVQPLTSELVEDWARTGPPGRNLKRLSDCPDALEFLTQPEVDQFYRKNFGYGYDQPEQHWFEGGCPEVTTLSLQFEEAQTRGGPQ